MENIRVRLIIKGRVQGVWFRDSTRRQAIMLGVDGWVKNRTDGNVEAVAEGPEDKVEELVKWCHHGPPHAKVAQVDVVREKWTGEYISFDIVY
ncbi:MAG: acylphosphatase [Deltaproteobacteria bacterium]|nr:acylphosphatase [Deltaproteobacteria bacterium]